MYFGFGMLWGLWKYYDFCVSGNNIKNSIILVYYPLQWYHVTVRELLIRRGFRNSLI